ncbi:glycosyltransferase family 87 protein [Phytoactinopolyspora limicola]|uniref:glycosyltransferase family 87 protein n=1 Tax=Phytoactinopolyspora limicola TaxID=2715536 RepID=UPI001409E397|nr:glycosyltransferase 87 family protein [Phytoactinopolyspora limicola]
MSPRIAQPSREDPVVATASEWVGGPVGRYALVGGGWWSPVRVAVAVACLVLAVGFVTNQPCHEKSWESREDPSVWTSLCYSDVPFLYRERGLADGEVVYVDRELEYPVLTGAVMQGSAVLARAIQSVTGPDSPDRPLAESVRFYEITVILMGLSAIVIVVATARTVPRRPWDAMVVAASPVLLLSFAINWDLLAVACTSLAILAWTRERPGWAGILLGLGAAAKLYPVLILGALLLVAMRDPDRARALRRLGGTVVAAVVSWSTVNLPVAMHSPQGWSTFFEFNVERAAEFGSVWYALGILDGSLGISMPAGDDINRLAIGAGLILLGLIIVLTMTAPEPPRLAQLAFLAVAAFLLINKVWSPQYTLWLLPLAALARPRWRELLIWQATEVLYFIAVWLYLAGFYGDQVISAEVYALSILIRTTALIWLMILVVRDIQAPGHDPVRAYVTGPAPPLSHGRAGAGAGASQRRARR